MNCFRLYTLILSFFLLILMQITGDLSSYRFMQNEAYPTGFYRDDPLPEKTAYLTFDDGPSEWTSGILDTLKAKNIHATFFICADWAPHSDRINNSFRKFKAVLTRMIKEGHVIGNHSADHKDFGKLSAEKIEDELDENQYLLNKELGQASPHMTLIRPPFGSPWYDKTPDVIRVKAGSVIRSRGLLILWSRHFDSADSLNWVRGDWYREAPRINISEEDFQKRMHYIYNRLINRADGSGMVILFHDTHLTTKTILPEIISKLKDLGYTFGTMEDYARWRWGKNSAEILSEQLSELKH